MKKIEVYIYDSFSDETHKVKYFNISEKIKAYDYALELERNNKAPNIIVCIHEIEI